jgi:hypothetical protein
VISEGVRQGGRGSRTTLSKRVEMSLNRQDTTGETRRGKGLDHILSFPSRKVDRIVSSQTSTHFLLFISVPDR